uniref:Uncharacterized protein n=1 Tax=candidate division CPR3 bacterium TaxID=2268181 RepID=A0A7C4M1B8_UNCC3
MELAAVANVGQISTGTAQVFKAAVSSQHENTGMQVAERAHQVIPNSNGADDVARISQQPRQGINAMAVSRISLEA